MRFGMHSCAWCNEQIPEDTEVFGFGAKCRPEVDLTAHEGSVIPFFIATLNRRIPAFVSASDSDAKRDGYDLVFMTCSRTCSESLKAALEKEKTLLDEADEVS
jgi:hypothetical protein